MALFSHAIDRDTQPTARRATAEPAKIPLGWSLLLATAVSLGLWALLIAALRTIF